MNNINYILAAIIILFRCLLILAVGAGAIYALLVLSFIL